MLRFFPRRHRLLFYQNKIKHPFQLYILTLIMLFVIHQRLHTRTSSKPNLYDLPPSPGPFLGTSASQLSPSSYFSSNARFLFYSAYGQFNNQLVSLINALFLARHADAILVLPYARLGKESTWDLRSRNLSTELASTRQLVGHYFNYSHLLHSNHAVLPEIFFQSRDGLQLLNAPKITVAYRTGSYFRRLFNFASKQYHDRSESHVNVLAPEHPKKKLKHLCDMNPHHALATVNHLGRNGRFIFLPVVFRRHNLNCTAEEPQWVSIRSSLVPRDEFLNAVDAFMMTLPRPIFSIHLRFFLNGDLGNFTPRSVVDMILRDFEQQLSHVKTIFLAYSPSSVESREVFALLKAHFRGVVVDGSESERFFSPEDTAYAKLALSAVLFDMWVCVKSDMFLGRLGSSLSWNTVYWRQALWRQYHLEEHVVQQPLWYELSNFTTTAARRREGPVTGVRYVTE